VYFQNSALHHSTHVALIELRAKKNHGPPQTTFHGNHKCSTVSKVEFSLNRTINVEIRDIHSFTLLLKVWLFTAPILTKIKIIQQSLRIFPVALPPLRKKQKQNKKDVENG
jgi:hypothetical protein